MRPEKAREVSIEVNFVPVKPLADRIIVCVEPPELKSKGGIIIPDTAQEKSLRGVVVAIGEQAKIGDHVKQTELKMGDTVLFNKFAGTPIDMPKEEGEFLIMREADALVILAHAGRIDCSDKEPDYQLFAEVDNDAK
jgi:chaperonin GroES